MENGTCPSGSGSGKKKGVVGTLGHLHKTEVFVHLVSCKLAENSSVTLSRTPQAAVNLEHAHWCYWMDPHGNVCSGELQWSLRVCFTSLGRPSCSSSLASVLSSHSFFSSHNFHAVCSESSSILKCEMPVFKYWQSLQI